MGSTPRLLLSVTFDLVALGEGKRRGNVGRITISHERARRGRVDRKRDLQMTRARAIPGHWRRTRHRGEEAEKKRNERRRLPLLSGHTWASGKRALGGGKKGQSSLSAFTLQETHKAEIELAFSLIPTRLP